MLLVGVLVAGAAVYAARVLNERIVLPTAPSIRPANTWQAFVAGGDSSLWVQAVRRPGPR
jgi:hypothetical protein